MLNICLLDVQGFGRIGDAADNRILAFLFLVCSMLVYNSEGAPNEQSLFGLRMINSIRDILSVAEDREKSDYQLSYYAPRLVWALRDFDQKTLPAGTSVDSFLEELLVEVGNNKVSNETLKVR